MNFGLALAAGQVAGVGLNLLALNGNHEPESDEAALTIYSRLLMPGRNVQTTLSLLTPLLRQPQLTAKVTQAANGVVNKALPATIEDQLEEDDKNELVIALNSKNRLAQVVGIILGSPEYQRR